MTSNYRKKVKIRADILKAAGDLCVAGGHQGISIRKIADRIEYSPTTIYLYFEDKDDLMNCLVNEQSSELLKEIEKQTSTIRDPLDRLKRTLSVYVDFWSRTPSIFLAGLLVAPSEAKNRKPSEQSLRTLYCTRLQGALDACSRKGLLRMHDVQDLTLEVWTCIHGVACTLLMQPGLTQTSLARVSRRTVDLLVAGICERRSDNAPAGGTKQVGLINNNDLWNSRSSRMNRTNPGLDPSRKGNPLE